MDPTSPGSGDRSKRSNRRFPKDPGGWDSRQNGGQAGRLSYSTFAEGSDGKQGFTFDVHLEVEAYIITVLQRIIV